MRKSKPPRVPSIVSRISTIDTRAAKPPPKTADPIYATPEYKTWRETVIRRAGRRCEATTPSGTRCNRAEPHHRLYADHIVELQDGGVRFDPANGQALCGAHHVAKTNSERVKRTRG